MLTIHHLGRSQSERIVWLCEELGVPYELTLHARDPVTILSPPALKALHPLGAAPVIQDDGVLLAESAAIVDYIIAKHGGGRLRLGPDHPDFAAYLYWFHFANGNLQPAMGRSMMVGRIGLAPDHPVQKAVEGRLDRVIALVEARLREADYLAGGAFTAAAGPQLAPEAPPAQAAAKRSELCGQRRLLAADEQRQRQADDRQLHHQHHPQHRADHRLSQRPGHDRGARGRLQRRPAGS